jgi:hypothetical protein
MKLKDGLIECLFEIICNLKIMCMIIKHGFLAALENIFGKFFSIFSYFGFKNDA